MKTPAKKSAAPAESASSKSAPFDYLLALCFVLVLAFYLWSTHIGWDNTITDRHSFRQTQTAISAAYMVHKPFKLAYETPVFGAPWSIPMEFPLYQKIAATVTEVFPIGLDQSGRLVSVLFLLLTLVPTWFLLAEFRVAPSHRWIALSAILTSPFYIFWSRTFMIETCALFFGVAFLAATISTLKRPTWWLSLIAVIAGLCGILVKITTFFPFVIGVLAFAVLDEAILRKTTQPLLKVRLAHLGAIFLLVMPTGIAWVKMADALKEKNPLGHFITSATLNSDAMNHWNYGTWSQKLSLDVWSIIFQRIFTLFTLDSLFYYLLLPAAVFFAIKNKRLVLSLVLVALYLASPAVFTNLQYMHDYYQCANGWFFIMAFSLIVIGFVEKFKSRLAAVAAIIGISVLGGTGHAMMYAPLQTYKTTLFMPSCREIEEKTPEDSVIIVLGSDWNPAIPYYSKRRALMFPEWATNDAIIASLKNLDPATLKAIVVNPYAPVQGQLDWLLYKLNAMGYPQPAIIAADSRELR